MKVTWLGHSAFKLENAAGVSVVTDPFEDGIGYHIPTVQADIVTTSHSHFDHNYVAGVKGVKTAVSKEGSHEFGDIEICGIHSYHDGAKGAKRGENIIFKYHMDGIELCHMGDIGEEWCDLFAKQIHSPDVLMIPVGGTYTIDAKQAKEYVDGLKPKVVIPMHYKTADCKLDIAKLDGFLKLFDETQIVFMDGASVEFAQSDFQEDRTKVLVLKKHA